MKNSIKIMCGKSFYEQITLKKKEMDWKEKIKK